MVLMLVEVRELEFPSFGCWARFDKTRLLSENFFEIGIFVEHRDIFGLKEPRKAASQPNLDVLRR